jgi:hypothetical protein
MDALAEINGLRRQLDLQVRPERNHWSPRTAANTMDSVT